MDDAGAAVGLAYRRNAAETHSAVKIRSAMHGNAPGPVYILLIRNAGSGGKIKSYTARH
jgi:hypothetical protein